MVVFVQIELRLALKKKRGKIGFVCRKKSRQIQMRQASFSVFTRYEKFVKTMSSIFSRSKELKISRQMNRSQKLKRKNTCKRHIQLHHSHPGLKNEAETKMRNEE